MAITYKVKKKAQELMQSDPHQVLNIKDRQIQLSSHKKKKKKLQSWQPFPKKVETLLPKLY